jgi:hypothetical protein
MSRVIGIEMSPAGQVIEEGLGRPSGTLPTRDIELRVRALHLLDLCDDRIDLVVPVGLARDFQSMSTERRSSGQIRFSASSGDSTFATTSTLSTLETTSWTTAWNAGFVARSSGCWIRMLSPAGCLKSS